LGDVRAVRELLARLPDQSRHQRVRIIEALRLLGTPGGQQILEYVRGRPASLPLVADLLPLVVGAAALDDLLSWSNSESPEVRAAALRALGTIGLDDRAFYYALKALGDESPAVRGMAARALGRTRRTAAVPYLSVRLDDEWEVAAHAARALAGLDPDGLEELKSRTSGSGLGADLARQMVWDAERRGGSGASSKPPAAHSPRTS
jgi:hypothetical protein